MRKRHVDPMNRRLLIGRLMSRRMLSDTIAEKVHTPCWLWQGCTNCDGYGSIRIGEHVRLVHRVSAYLWLDLDLTNDAELARHRCVDRKACFNPRHLMLGTHADNNADAVADGRSGRRELNADDVRKLIYAVRSGRLTMGKWAAGRGIAYATAYRAYHAINHTELAIKYHALCDKRFSGTLFGKPSPIGVPLPKPRATVLFAPERDDDYLAALSENETAAPF